MSGNNGSLPAEIVQGLKMRKALLSCLSVIAITGMAFAFTVQPVSAQDQKKQPSDRTVDFLKTFVEGFLIPEEIPLGDGTKMKVDRANEAEMKKFEIPRDDMRRIIRIAYNGATAEICERYDLQEAAYSWMKFKEFRDKKWTKRQKFFISRLYVATVMWQTGSAGASKEGESAEKTAKSPNALDNASDKKVVCTPARRETTKKLEAFLKAQDGKEG